MNILKYRDQNKLKLKVERQVLLKLKTHWSTISKGKWCFFP